MHRERRVGPDPQRRLGDHAELAVAEDHAAEQFRVEVVGAFDDLAGRRHHLQGHRLVGAATEARRIHVDAADAQRAAHGRGHVERRGKVVQILPAQFLGQAVPVDAGLAAHGQRIRIYRQHPAHARHVEQHAAVGHRFALGGEAAAAHRDRHAMHLRRLQQAGDLRRTAGDNHPVRQAVGCATSIRGEDAACRGAFRHVDARGAQRDNEVRPAGAVPARGIGLLADDALQGIGRHRTGTDGAGFKERDFQRGCPFTSQRE